ncbi:hypothetical protein H7J87_27240 [Mycolicibacterium wolinskyi]|uniref:hypothetical protein n=1 Tax=Mycolicibacterium TaxID=1866885 RepID=UPI001A984DB3|nr:MULTISPECIES: hypothetical protein [Mycolicibacterium]MCV7289029.1 hypothetical protein [Mycolicibacterium wolinskyi]MCV7296456.1 hypothetical protein [Mycolicibacterium goodii]
MNSAKNRRKLKVASAGVGAAAGLAMAVAGVGLSGGLAGAQNEVEPPALTTGETVTETVPPTSPETSVATPSVSATTPSGFAEPH